jgi:hypothetical protein
MQRPLTVSATCPSVQHSPHAAAFAGSQQEPLASMTLVGSEQPLALTHVPPTAFSPAGQPVLLLPVGGVQFPSRGAGCPARGPLSHTQAEVTGPVLFAGGDVPVGHLQVKNGRSMICVPVFWVAFAHPICIG